MNISASGNNRSAYEERGPVGTEHSSPKLHWFASLPSRYATNCMHPYLICKILKTLITTLGISSLFATLQSFEQMACNSCLLHARKPLDSRHSSEMSSKCGNKIVLTFVGYPCSNWKPLLFKNTSRISCPISLHS